MLSFKNVSQGFLMRTYWAEFYNIDKTTAGRLIFSLIHQSMASQHLVVEGVDFSSYNNIFFPTFLGHCFVLLS